MHLPSHMRVDPTREGGPNTCGTHPHVREKMHAPQTPYTTSIEEVLRRTNVKIKEIHSPAI